MKTIAVFGASGLTGQECVYQALKNGDTVIGLTRYVRAFILENETLHLFVVDHSTLDESLTQKMSCTYMHHSSQTTQETPRTW